MPYGLVNGGKDKAFGECMKDFDVKGKDDADLFETINSVAVFTLVTGSDGRCCCCGRSRLVVVVGSWTRTAGLYCCLGVVLVLLFLLDCRRGRRRDNLLFPFMLLPLTNLTERYPPHRHKARLGRIQQFRQDRLYRHTHLGRHHLGMDRIQYMCTAQLFQKGLIVPWPLGHSLIRKGSIGIPNPMDRTRQYIAEKCPHEQVGRCRPGQRG